VALAAPAGQRLAAVVTSRAAAAGWRPAGWRPAAWLLAALLSLGGATAQPVVDAWPRPVERALLGEPAWRHAEGRERLLRELVALFERHYWNPDHVDWAAWAERHRAEVVEAVDRAALDAALGRMVRALADDHSSWAGLPVGAPEPRERETPAAPRLGVQLAYLAGRGLVIERVYPDTPAAAADLRRADVIAAVGGLDLRDLGGPFEANAALAAALAEGPASLLVQRGRHAFEVEVAASPVAFGEVAAHPYAVMLDGAVGYLHVPSFNEAGIGAAVHTAVRGLQEAGARSLVLDLRGNLGGRLVEAGLAVGAFVEGVWARAIARGEVAWEAVYALETRAGVAEGVARLQEPGGGAVGEARVGDPVRFAGSVVVVVGSETASAAEIVAAALAGAGRARVVGERTQGNVEAVRAYALSDGSRVLVAIARVVGADGVRLDDGVEPEVVARAGLLDLARGVDPPVSEALRLLGGLPFTPGRWF